MQEESDLSHDMKNGEVPGGEMSPVEPSLTSESIADPLTGIVDSLDEDSQLPASPAEEIAAPAAEAESEPEALEIAEPAATEPEPETPEPEPEPETPEPEPAQQPEPEPETPKPDSRPDADTVEALSVSPTAARVPWWPFIVLAVLWLSLSGTAAYLLTRASDMPAYQQEWYFAIVLAGVVLTLLGPLVAIVTWAVVRREAAVHERGALFVGSILRGSAITLVGVLAWWGTLVVVDALRLGLIRF